MIQQTNNTNLSRIREQLNMGRRITSISVLNSIGTTEIRHYLSILRHEGLNIKDRWLEKDNKRFKEWWIE